MTETMHLETVETDKLGCPWPQCDHLDDPERAFGLDAGDGITWCLCHFGDDCLPEVRESTVLDECARCGDRTGWLTREGVHLHPECRRVWAMAQDARPAMGAYARRSRG